MIAEVYRIAAFRPSPAGRRFPLSNVVQQLPVKNRASLKLLLLPVRSNREMSLPDESSTSQGRWPVKRSSVNMEYDESVV